MRKWAKDLNDDQKSRLKSLEAWLEISDAEAKGVRRDIHKLYRISIMNRKRSAEREG